MENKRTIAGIRKDLNLNQNEMAKKLDISITTLQRYETGKSPVPYTIALKIADMGGIKDLRSIRFN